MKGSEPVISQIIDKLKHINQVCCRLASRDGSRVGGFQISMTSLPLPLGSAKQPRAALGANWCHLSLTCCQHVWQILLQALGLNRSIWDQPVPRCCLHPCAAPLLGVHPWHSERRCCCGVPERMVLVMWHVPKVNSV